MNGSNFSLLTNGRIDTFTGAILGGKDKNVLFVSTVPSSLVLVLKECSRME